MICDVERYWQGKGYKRFRNGSIPMWSLPFQYEYLILSMRRYYTLQQKEKGAAAILL